MQPNECSAEERAQRAVVAFGDERFREGVEVGLQVAEQIRVWLTRRPDKRWQAEVREWADKAVLEARRRHGLLNGLDPYG